MARSQSEATAIDIDALFLTEEKLPKARDPEGKIITSTQELHAILKKLGIIIPRKDVIEISKGDGFEPKKTTNPYEKALFMNNAGAARFMDFVNGRIENIWDDAKAK